MADESAESEGERSVRDAVERSRSGAPAAGRVIRDRFSSDEIFQRIVAAADEEITASSRELFFSGLAAGFAITITFLLYASLTASTGGDPVLSAMLYPLGFIYIIIGGYQLYTENTLPPVALTIERLASVPALLRNWVVVLSGNFLGGLLGAATLAWGGVLSSAASAEAFAIAQKGIETAPGVLFVKAAFAGLIVAGVVWVEYAARDTISRLVVVYLAFLAIPLGNLFHVVVSFTETMYLVFNGAVAVQTGLVEFVLPVLAGNTAGGVVLVTVVNYFQTSEERIDSARFEGARRQLSPREWLLGGIVGRSYVPLVDTTGERTDEEYRVLVPIADPDTAHDLADLAGAIAADKPNAVVTLTHVVQTYDPHSDYAGADGRKLVSESDARLRRSRRAVEAHGVDCETSTVVSHRPFREVFEVADYDEVDLICMRQGDEVPWSAGATDNRFDELLGGLPCDVLVFQDRGLDPERVLLPVMDTPHASLGGEVAGGLVEAFESDVTLAHTVEPGRQERGEQFLRNWAIDHDLEDADRVVDDSGDVEATIGDLVEDHSLLIVGAVERGLLGRLLHRSLRLRILEDVETSVLLVERPTHRGLLARLLGR